LTVGPGALPALTGVTREVTHEKVANQLGDSLEALAAARHEPRWKGEQPARRMLFVSG